MRLTAAGVQQRRKHWLPDRPDAGHPGAGQQPGPEHTAQLCIQVGRPVRPAHSRIQVGRRDGPGRLTSAARARVGWLTYASIFFQSCVPVQ